MTKASESKLRAIVRENTLKSLAERDGAHEKGGYCFYCERTLNFRTKDRSDPAYTTIDHVRPRSKGGENGTHNYVLACAPCNEAKGRNWWFFIDVIRELRKKVQGFNMRDEQKGAHIARIQNRLATLEAYHVEYEAMARLHDDDPEAFKLLHHHAKALAKLAAGEEVSIEQRVIRDQVKIIKALRVELAEKRSTES